MSNPILVDSSFFISLLGRRVDPLALLAETEDLFDYAVTPAIWVEVVRGRTFPHLRDRFQAAFDDFLCFPDTREIAAHAARLGWDLERAGNRIPLPDLLIAAAARIHEVPLLTFDRHFDRISGLVVITRLPVG